ncbi:unnamed protein product [Rotaria sordida]|uniref:Thiamine pyrophosphate enzyme TPP-binding domain-containing protein n=1 Tax=Rotaria sordida TaxID=392033 RepID=A0A815PN02_9BILA|nr:unnamed protein product [Rotaria sordida]CAF1639248.1 unnamed protein product [Rotaria sordida]
MPVGLLDSQSILPPTSTSDLVEPFESMDIRYFLGGAVCDFHLGYGKVLSRKSKIIIINRNSFCLYQNSDVFVWKPTLTINGDPANFIVRLHKISSEKNYKFPNLWIESLRDKDNIKQEANLKKGLELTVDHLNSVRVLQELENQSPDNAILISDHGDFVATPVYLLCPREPLTWLDPGAFGTLAVGVEFPLGIKLVRPEASLWIIYGNDALGYSIMEYDTFIRHKIYELFLIDNVLFFFE